MSELHLIRGTGPAAAKSPASHDTAFINLSDATTAGGSLGGVAPTDSPQLDVSLDSLAAGSRLGSYLIMSKVGEGGMGAVYKAHDTVLNRTVALKVLSPQLFRNREFLERFRIEAQAQARLNGPNIVTLYSMFDVPNSLVLVLEYIEGQTLSQRLQNEGHLSVAATVWVFEQTLLGVDRAHRMGIVHRDLKSSNIFITSNREVKLMDFGVAKIMNNDGPTQVGSVIGTLRYISPEQINGQDADFRSDIYSLGITLYEAVTGTIPFNKKTEYEYMNAHLHDAPPLPTSLNASIPKELEGVILKAIAKDPNDRFQSAREFRNALLTLGIKHVRAYRRIKAHQRNTGDSVVVAAQLDATRTDLIADIPKRLRWVSAWHTYKPWIAVGLSVISIAALSYRLWSAQGRVDDVVPPLMPPVAVVASSASPVSEAEIFGPPVPPELFTTAPTPAAVEPVRVKSAAAAATAPKPAPPTKYDMLKHAWGE